MSRLVVALLVLAATAAATAAPAGAAAPNLRLLVDERARPLTTQHVRGVGLPLPEGVLLATEGAPLELQATRGRDGRVTVEQALREAPGLAWRPTGLGAPTLPRGLHRFLHLRLQARDGRVVLDERRDVCPTLGALLRVDPRTGRARYADERARSYPFGCGHVLSQTVPIGVPRGHAVELGFAAWSGQRARVTPGIYDATLTIDPDGELEQATRADDVLRFRVRVRGEERAVPGPRARVRAVAAAGRADAAASASAASGVRAARGLHPLPPPGPDLPLPDLSPLPSAFIELERGRLAFDGMVANVGAAPLVVRGPRRAAHRATQLFELGGRAVAQLPVGRFEFERGEGHRHWHFRDLARYRLRDAAGRVVARSGKIGFCFMNTHAVAVRLDDPRTPLRPRPTGGCGLRETQRIDAGWGDLYVMSAAGQSLDVRRVPDGEYALEIEVDPGRRLHQVTRANDVSVRTLRLERGPSGRRRVVVPPVEGVDTVAEMRRGVFPLF